MDRARSMDGKLGTFGGVFTPSLLTILGVIMYLRVPWLVGNAGLYETLGILLAAHIVSVATGLSVSSISTDKKVGVGGSYYILSRSFGLPIGGAIGLALFVGLSFTIAMHIVGFSESVLAALDIPMTANAIRVCGSITLVAVTSLIFISTSLAIKTQYVILVLIAASLASVFLGHSTAHHGAALATAKGAPSFGVLFGIFFPAVTGFTTGLNMSGDLRDPKGSIPKGTMAAIAAAAVIYVVLVVFLSYRVDRDSLRDDPEVLQHFALWGPAVIAGLWGASLSSALGAIMGAPRILQAMSVDRITPRVFAVGRGATNEPRNALILAFGIGEVGILIAQLDMIARVVSTVFLALYGAICLSCAIESWANPDFRPKFRIPRLVSLVGAGACLLLMIQLDLLATAGAAALLLGLYGYLKRRQLRMEGGGTWEGLWSTIVRAGLARLHQASTDQRSWRPNVMLFDEAEHPSHAAIRDFAATLASGNGMVTDFALARSGRAAASDTAPPAGRVGIFDVRIATTDPLDTVATMCRYHGFAGVPPNTVLLRWRQHAEAPEAFLRALAAATDRDLNTLLFEEPRAPVRAARPRLDLWWAPEAGNLPLGVALVRFITGAPEWERAQVQVLIVGDGGDGDALARAKATRFLESSRLDARVRVVVRPRGERLHDVVCNESRPADLILLGLPAELDRDNLGQLDRVAALPGGVVFLRASGAFPDVLAAHARAPAPSVPATGDAMDPGAGAAVPPEAVAEPLALPAHPELAAAVTTVVDHLRGQLGGVHERASAAIAPYFEVASRARELVVRRGEALAEAAHEVNPARRRRLVNRATSAFVASAGEALAAIADDEISAQAAVLGEQLAAIVQPGAAQPQAVPPVLRIERPRADFRTAPDDGRALRRWKRWRRWRYFYRRQIPLSIPIGRLVERAHERLVCDELARTIDRLRTASHDLANEVGRVLATTEWKAHAQLVRLAVDDPAGLASRVADAHAAIVRRLDAVCEHTRQRVTEHQLALEAAVRDASRRLADELDRVEAPLLVKRRAPRREDVTAMAALPAAAELWRERQLRVVQRVRLATHIGRFLDRLTAASTGHAEELFAGVRASGQRACTELRTQLGERAADGPLPVLRDDLPYDPAPAVARFARAAASVSSDLPESETLLTDEAVAALVRGDQTSDTSTVAVRSAVQGLVETELITRLGGEAMKLAEADARAWAIARDTIVLLAARPREAEDDDAALEPSQLPVGEACERLDAQLAKLRELERAFAESVVDGLEAVATAIELDGLCASLEARSGRAREGDRASKLGALVRRGVSGARELAARAVYRRSAGIVFAHETHAARDRAAAHAIRELASRAGAAPAVLAQLPLYYRNLFMGQININEAFFASRADQVAAGAAALRGERTGPRSVLVSGRRGAGKTTLCQQVAHAAGGEVFWLAQPHGTGPSRAALQAALEAALGGSGTPAQLLARVQPGSVLVVDDLDLWWERRTGGLDAIDELCELIGGHADRVGFVLGSGLAAMRVIGALRPLSSVVQADLSCRPLAARELDKVVLARHASTGLKLKLGQREALGTWARARLFDAHFSYSGGNVGFALRSWVAHVDELAEDTLAIRVPKALDWDALDDLAPEQAAVLLELVLHKSADADKLARVTGDTLARSRAALAELAAMGLVVQSRRHVAQLNPFVHVPVIEWMRRRELA